MTTTLTEQTGNNVCQAEPQRDGMTYTPRFDIWETDDEVVLYGDMPGVLPENLDIHFEQGQLLIHGRVDPRHDEIQFLCGEYGIGDYHRVFNLGEAIDTEKIEAELKHGVLTLRLPKPEHVKPHKIEVKAG